MAVENTGHAFMQIVYYIGLSLHFHFVFVTTDRVIFARVLRIPYTAQYHIKIQCIPARNLEIFRVRALNVCAREHVCSRESALFFNNSSLEIIIVIQLELC